jgi:hypothetical protein
MKPFETARRKSAREGFETPAGRQFHLAPRGPVAKLRLQICPPFAAVFLFNPNQQL